MEFEYICPHCKQEAALFRILRDDPVWVAECQYCRKKSKIGGYEIGVI